MALFLISGTAGTGKSQVCKVLKKRGYEAYDADDDGIARWQNKKTGYIHPKSSVASDKRNESFIEENSWNVPRKYVEGLLLKAKNHPIFLCGSLGNEKEIRDLFKKVLALYVDDKTLKHRLATRTTNDWGKKPHELEQTLKHHHQAYDKHRELGDIVIDATRPLDEVVNEIVDSVGV